MGPWSNFIDTIKNTAKISEVVKGYTKVEPLGNNRYKACCPLHSEKTPSFTCDDSKGIFYCFGCQAGGDVLNFLQMKEGISNFRQAAERLAERFNIPMPSKYVYNKEEEERFEQMQMAMDGAAKIFQEEIRKPENSHAMQYLLSRRKLSPKIIEEFGIGFIGKSANVSDKLTKLGIRPEILVQVGISRERSGSFLDFFYNRIMIPILDQQSRIVGFGGRCVEEQNAVNNGPKYLNSPDSPIFKKGDILFNFGKARLSVFAEKQNILVVEGYMDVIAASIMGHKACVAPLGTSVTSKQLSMILSIDNAPIVCFNADAAGKKAAFRCAKICLPLLKTGAVVKFAFPSGVNIKDIDDIRTSAINDDDAKRRFQATINSAQELQDFVFNNLAETIDARNPNEMAKLEKEIKEILELIKDENIKTSYKEFFKSKTYYLYRNAAKKPNKRAQRNTKLNGNSRWAKQNPPAHFGINIKVSDLQDADLTQLKKSSAYHLFGIIHMAICFPYLFLGKLDLKQHSEDVTGLNINQNIKLPTEENQLNKLLEEIENCSGILTETDEETEERIARIAETARLEIKSMGQPSLSGIIHHYSSKLLNSGTTDPLKNQYLQACLNGNEIEDECFLKMLNRYVDEAYSSQVSFAKFLENSTTRPATQMRYLVLLYTSAKISEEIEAIESNQQSNDQEGLINLKRQLYNELHTTKREIAQMLAEEE